MSSTELPRHIVDRFERRWAQKLEQQARAWKSVRSESPRLPIEASPSFDGCSARGRHKNQLEGLRLLLPIRRANSSRKSFVGTQFQPRSCFCHDRSDRRNRRACRY
jgi:hypothetical protein